MREFEVFQEVEFRYVVRAENEDEARAIVAEGEARNPDVWSGPEVVLVREVQP